MTLAAFRAKLWVMRHSIGLLGLGLALAGLGGCPSDDTTMDTGLEMMSSTGPAAVTTTGFDPTSTGITAASNGTSGAESTGPDEGSSSGEVADGSSGSSGGEPACEPPVVGEWNSCIDETGSVDNTLCNWIGNPDGTGFLTCINAPAGVLDGGNFCSIRDCVDVCDCFDPPATGTAPVICSPILADGATACGLDCSGGQTCPDGMECASGLCFWPPAA